MNKDNNLKTVQSSADGKNIGLLKLIKMVAMVLGGAGCILILLALLGMPVYPFGVFSVLVSAILGAMSLQKLQGYFFTGCILICISTAMFFPDAFVEWHGFKLETLIVPLTQLIMFGMGATLSLRDFTRVVKSPLPLLLGVLFQFAFMPLLGYYIAHIFGFDGEIAAGIILIGSCSGGMASNVMTYLAGGNVALSVSMTFVSTLAAPLATPMLMQVLAGRFVPIETITMMFSILNMVIVPLIAGLVAHKIFYSNQPWTRKANVLIVIALAALSASVLCFFYRSGLGVFSTGLIVGSALIATTCIIRLIISVWLRRPDALIDRLLPTVSMAGICAILTIIIAQTYEVLIAVGVLLLVAAIIHNCAGFLLGYLGSKAIGRMLGNVGYRLRLFETPASRIDESESRTIAIEVGMQNGGMATGLAIDVLHSYVAALPPNLFGTWMNISGSVLANYWQQRPVPGARVLATGASPSGVLQ